MICQKERKEEEEITEEGKNEKNRKSNLEKSFSIKCSSSSTFYFLFVDFSFFFFRKSSDSIRSADYYYPIERIYSNWIVNRDYRDAKRRKEEKKIKKKEKGNEGSRMPFPGQRIRLTLT